MVSFYFPDLHYFYYLEFFYRKDLSLSMYLLIYSLIYINLGLWIFTLFYVLWSQTIIFYFAVHIVPELVISSFSGWLLCLCNLLSTLSTFLLSNTRCFRLILCFSLSRPEINHFFKKFWFSIVFGTKKPRSRHWVSLFILILIILQCY